ncbi:MAG TPA: FKBP-type peptidyl-prolyl cis-trans isomerase [candidate division Zixibacteria bacterium]|nr:FKBP-type peptidyl-prolyl cis-trans isomerase [candidate division Zixibacteria bacterium]
MRILRALGIISIIITIPLLTGCSQPKTAHRGDLVTIQAVGRTMDGVTFVTTTPATPWKFKIGSDEVLPGIDRAVDGMAEGESKTVDLEMQDAYGPRNEQAVATISREHLPSDIQLIVGKTLTFNPPDGQQQQFVVVAFTDDSVTLDGNHPLAGQTVQFDLKLIKIEPAGE